MIPKSFTQRLDENQPIYQAIYNTNHSYAIRINRLNQRMRAILEAPVSYFITFTIKDDYIDIKPQTITRKIKEALSNASSWVANADYGELNGRLHFHSLACYNFHIDYNTITSIYKYGAVNIKPIIIKNDKALKEYLLKQTLHSIKHTASNIIYSRSRKNDDHKL